MTVFVKMGKISLNRYFSSDLKCKPFFLTDVRKMPPLNYGPLGEFAKYIMT